MRINSINQSYLKSAFPHKIPFHGNVNCRENVSYHPALKVGQVIDPNTKGIFNRNTTCYFRNDLDWLKFGQYLEDRFQGQDKINTYIWGCSEGDEAYSLVMLAHSIKNGSKFYPIQAMDIMPHLINANKTRQKTDIFIGMRELERIRSAVGYKNIKKVLESPPPRIAGMVKLKDEIKDKVEFSCSNIVTDMDKIDNSTPALVMCRNMWPYIDSDLYDSCAKTLYNKLKKGSSVVIGTFDLEGDYHIIGSDNFPDSLIYAGFKPVDTAQGKVEKYKGSRKPFLIYEKPY